MAVIGTFHATSPRHWAANSRVIEEAGYESIWIPEHVVLPVQIAPSPKTGHADSSVHASLPAYDPWIEMATMAAATSTLRFGTYTYNIGYRHPFLTARALTTLDVVSGGRVDLGIGASWLREEWEAFELPPFESRGRIVDEAIDIVRRLLTEDTVEHHGEFFAFEPVGFYPKPVQKPHPPLHIGGDSPSARRRAARFGDGWCPHMETAESLPGNLERIREMRADLGRTGDFEVTMRADVRTVDDIRRWEEAGVTRILKVPLGSPKEAMDGLKRFSDEVMSKL